MTLLPNTPITVENVGLLKAGDWLLRIHDGAMAQYCGLAVFHPDDAPRVIYTIGGHIQGNAPLHAFRYIGPDLGDGWIGWSGGDNPVPAMRVEVVRRYREGHKPSGNTYPSQDFHWGHRPIGRGGMDDIIAFRPALSPPAEGLGHTDLMISPEAIDAFLATGEHPLITPTPPSVDWQRVGPKLMEALATVDAMARSGAAMSAANYSVSAEKLGESIYKVTTPILAALSRPNAQGREG